MRIGALEAGGTKMVCAIGNERGEILERMTIPTEIPEITMPQMIRFFQERQIEALGIGCFRTSGSEQEFRDLRIYYDHTKAGMGELQYRWGVSKCTPCSGRI